MNGVSKLARGFAYAVAALCAGSAVNAWADTPGEKTPLPGAPGVGWTRTIVNDDQTVDVVVAFTNTSAYASGYSFEVPADATAIDYLVVAGGGSGGYGHSSGGGGAGGVVTNTSPYPVTSGDFLSITVGAGANGGTKGGSGLEGGRSKIVLVATEAEVANARGGGGGAKGDAAGLAGGSGGGSGGSGNLKVLYAGGAAEEGQGHAGGTSYSLGKHGGCGGGGAGTAGSSCSGGNLTGGRGGNGILFGITGELTGYAAGGSGGGSAATSLIAGGLAGDYEIGGKGGSSGLNATDGVAGTGSGGGGSGNYNYSLPGKGGSGIVVIRYAKMVQATFAYASEKCTVLLNGEAVEGTSAYTRYGADAVVTVTPGNIYEYKTAPDGWTLVDGSITKTYTSVTADFEVVIPDPEEKGGEKFAVTFTEAEHATKVATIEGIEIGSEVLKGSTVVVVATPDEHYEYASVSSPWTGGETSITNTFVVNEATNVVIPEPTMIMVTVNVTGLEHTSYVIATNGVDITEDPVVPEGASVTITVTPAENYVYSQAPTGWTLNSNGTISQEIVTVKNLPTVTVPGENFGKRQVEVRFAASGSVTYAATNKTVEVEVRHKDRVDYDATISVVVTPRQTYAIGDVPQGWTRSGNALVGEFAAGEITIPVAVWSPTDGELIENGGFENFHAAAGYSAIGGSFPSTFLGGWVGHLANDVGSTSCYGVWKSGDSGPGDLICEGSAHSGTFAGGVVGLNNDYIQVPFTTPSHSKSSSVYDLSYWRKNVKYRFGTPALVVTIRDATGAQVGETIETSGLTTEWAKKTAEITGLEKDTTYYLRFDVGSGKDRNFALDDVSLKMKPPRKGLILFIK